jgi:hypothetical protein
VIPYSVEGMLDTAGQKIKIFSEHLTGLDFYLDPSMIHAGSAGEFARCFRTRSPPWKITARVRGLTNRSHRRDETTGM